MRHNKRVFKLGRTTSHKRCMIANMLKSLIDEERIETTTTKAKELRRFADRMITVAKGSDTVASKRKAVSELMISFNPLTSKEARAAKNGDKSAYNRDRFVIEKLFSTLATRFATRQGGYTRVIRSNNRVGDNASMSIVEYLSE